MLYNLNLVAGNSRPFAFPQNYCDEVPRQTWANRLANRHGRKCTGELSRASKLITLSVLRVFSDTARTSTAMNIFFSTGFEHQLLSSWGIHLLPIYCSI